MREFLEREQESAAACENRDIGPFRKCPKQMTPSLSFAYLKNSGLEALLRNLPQKLFWKGPRTLRRGCVVIWEGQSLQAGSSDHSKIIKVKTERSNIPIFTSCSTFLLRLRKFRHTKKGILL